MATAIVWFRRDLRLDDNPALCAALKSADRVLPLYIHAPADESPWQPGAASRWWLHHSLSSLKSSLQALGSDLHIAQGEPQIELERIVAATGAESVYWNRLYEPTAIERDAQIKCALRSLGVRTESHNGALLAEPWEIATGQGDPYKVFTPFWKRLRPRLDACSVKPAPTRMPPLPPTGDLQSSALKTLDLLPDIRWDSGFYDHWLPGEIRAKQRLSAFVGSGMADYAEERDLPARDGTSLLSPHLHFGELSPRRIVDGILKRGNGGGFEDIADAWLRQLGWRDFAHHLLYHFPHTTDEPLDARFRDFPWENDPAALKAWQRGRTGIPIVDAGMRQLWHTGWMHNRVRMLVASLLTKNLRIHWLEGARWFWDTLVDANLANNTLGWQWVAGCGADAAPYFRVFNPVLQGRRFDPGADYIAAWVPELGRLPAPWRHEPWLAPVDLLEKAGLARDSVYRNPTIDLARSREAALTAWRGSRA